MFAPMSNNLIIYTCCTFIKFAVTSVTQYTLMIIIIELKVISQLTSAKSLNQFIDHSVTACHMYNVCVHVDAEWHDFSH